MHDMHAIREWLHRLSGTLLQVRRDGDLEDELRLHMDMAAEAARRRGLNSADSARAARLVPAGSGS